MPIPFTIIDWTEISKKEKVGESGISIQQTLEYPGLKIRIVEYVAGFMADHWCKKGHIVHCLEGSFTSEMETGEKFQLSEGMTYIVSDNLSSHRSHSEKGTRLLIIDGEFLKS